LLIKKIILLKYLDPKNLYDRKTTEEVPSSDPPLIKWNIRFITVPFKPFFINNE